MRKAKIILLLTVSAAMVILGACADRGGDTAPTATKGANVTATAASTPTIEPTPTPTPSPTKEPLPAEELGKPSEKSEVVYINDFDDSSLDETLLVQQGKYSIEDGKLYLGSKDGGETWEGWDCLTPDVACYPSDAYQWEFHMDFQTAPQGTDTNPWIGAIIGARVANYTSAIANTDDGIWVAFTPKNSITVYPSGVNSEGFWPTGAVTVEIPEGFAEMHKVIIVDTGSSLFYYMKKTTGESVLILRIDITADEIKIFDGAGNEKKKDDKAFANYLDMEEGNHFKLFSHIGKTIIDNITIKSY